MIRRHLFLEPPIFCFSDCEKKRTANRKHTANRAACSTRSLAEMAGLDPKSPGKCFPKSLWDVEVIMDQSLSINTRINQSSTVMLSFCSLKFTMFSFAVFHKGWRSSLLWQKSLKVLWMCEICAVTSMTRGCFCIRHIHLF